MTKYKVSWKKDFLECEWYRDNPAEKYLTDVEKQYIILNRDNLDLDSEAEAVEIDDDTNESST